MRETVCPRCNTFCRYQAEVRRRSSSRNQALGQEKKQRGRGAVPKGPPGEPTSSHEPRPKEIRKGATKNAEAGPNNEDDGDDDADADCANYQLVLMGAIWMGTTLTGDSLTEKK